MNNYSTFNIYLYMNAQKTPLIIEHNNTTQSNMNVGKISLMIECNIYDIYDMYDMYDMYDLYDA